MKKLAISLLSILAVAVLCFSFAGCGANGTYKFESLTVGVGSLSKTYSVGEEYLGQELTVDWFTIKLENNGECSIKVNDSDSAKAGTWKEEDGKITFSVEGIDIGAATRDGNKITFNYGVMQITLKK